MQRGREEVYTEVLESFGPAIERLARADERDLEQRRDLLREIHIALWRSLGKFDGRCSLKTWVYRVAHNIAISKVIRRQRKTASILELADETLSSGPRSEEDALDRRRALDRVYELIQELRPLDRQVILLYLEGMDATSIAEITGLSAANVATKVHRTKEILIRQFHQWRHHE